MTNEILYFDCYNIMDLLYNIYDIALGSAVSINFSVNFKIVSF